MVRAASSELLTYGLFTDASRSINWGDSPASNAVAGTGNGLAQSLTIYGRIASGQSTVPVGVYTHIVTVTVNY